MNNQLLGIHHITALASDPQQNVDFYIRVLGLRLVKQTVNFDAPDVYHLYYGDDLGRPGTVLTFFPFPAAAQGKRGTGEISAVSFTVPASSVEFWARHLAQYGVSFEGPKLRSSEELISFLDPDGMKVDLIFKEGVEHYSFWQGGPIPPENALRGFAGASFVLEDPENTIALLTDTMGFELTDEGTERIRLSLGEDRHRIAIDVVALPNTPRARQSAGSVHHIAWRVADDETQIGWQQRIADTGIRVTDILDRNYFHSIYFREPGGILFEIATDGPGFTVDESPEELGTHLKLPPWIELQRDQLERILPPLTIPKV